MEKRYRVTLLEDERQELQSMVSVGKAAARKLVRARILLLADQAEGGPGKKDPEIADALGCGRMTITRARKQFVEEGMDATLSPNPPRWRPCLGSERSKLFRLFQGLLSLLHLAS